MKLSEVQLKLLHTTQSAIPFDVDFWGRLAAGLFLPVEELKRILAEMMEARALLGWHGELNPALAEAREVLASEAPPEGGPMVRWRATGTDGDLASLMWLGGEGAPGAWNARACRKSWGRIRPTMRSGFDLLAPDTDRTIRIPEGETATLKFDTEHEALAAEFITKRRAIDLATSPWEELGENLNIAPAAAISVSKRLVVNRIVRRIAFRFSPKGLGMRGCVLASWAIADAADAQGAAGALAALEGAMEVFVRDAEPASGANVTCLIVGADAGSGADAARRIGEQWGRAPVLLRELEIE